MPEKLTLSVREVAVQLGISVPKAYELVKTDGFPTVYLGKRIVVPVEALHRWLNAQVNV